MRSSSSCPSTPPRSRSSSCVRPRKRGPLPPLSSIAYAIPPPTVKTPLKRGKPVEGTQSRPLSRRTASSLSMPGTQSMSQRPPERTTSGLTQSITNPSSIMTSEPSTWPSTWPSTSLPCSGTSGSKEERPRNLLPQANPSARPFRTGTVSALSSSSQQDCLDSEEQEIIKLKPESVGDKPSSSCKQQPLRPNISEKSSSSSKTTKEVPEQFEEGKYSKSEGRKEVRKLQEAIEMSTSSGRSEYLPDNNVKVYLHKPGLEAEPGPPAPPPSRACSSPGSSSP
jgi:hypothetical protein